MREALTAHGVQWLSDVTSVRALNARVYRQLAATDPMSERGVVDRRTGAMCGLSLGDVDPSTAPRVSVEAGSPVVESVRHGQGVVAVPETVSVATPRGSHAVDECAPTVTAAAVAPPAASAPASGTITVAETAANVGGRSDSVSAEAPLTAATARVPPSTSECALDTSSSFKSRGTVRGVSGGAAVPIGRQCVVVQADALLGRFPHGQWSTVGDEPFRLVRFDIARTGGWTAYQCGATVWAASWC